MLKSIVEQRRPQMTIWSMHIAHWITKATERTHTHKHTLTICNIYCFSATSMMARKPLSVTLHVHCQSCSVEKLLARQMFNSDCTHETNFYLLLPHSVVMNLNYVFLPVLLSFSRIFPSTFHSWLFHFFFSRRFNSFDPFRLRCQFTLWTSEAQNGL